MAFGAGTLLVENNGGQIHTAANRLGLPSATGSHRASNLETAIYYARGSSFIRGADSGQILTTPNGTGTAVRRTAAPRPTSSGNSPATGSA